MLRVLKQAVPPLLNDVQGMPRSIRFASQVLQLALDRFGIEFAHKAANVLQLAATALATFDAAMFFNREAKEGGSSKVAKSWALSWVNARPTSCNRVASRLRALFDGSSVIRLGRK